MIFKTNAAHWIALLLAVPGMQAAQNGTASLVDRKTKGVVWSNWEDTVTCYPRQLSEPTTIDEVQALVKGSPKVRPAGLGHSFNRAVCADGGLMLDMSSMNDVLELNTHESYVRTEPGVSTRQLLHWLREKGWTLPTYPYYIDQSIGGAIATGTHGSSTKIGSLSSLLLSLTIVTASGKAVEFTPDDGEDWEAARVSVGLLGVIVELKLRVVPDRKVWKVCQLVSGKQIQATVDQFAKNPEAVDGVNILFSPPLSSGIRTSPKEKTAKGDKWSPLKLGPITVGGGNVPLSQALLTQTEELTAVLRKTFGSYDQYEFMISQELASGCFQAFRDFFKKRPLQSVRVLIPALIRFVKEEDAFLSPTNGGARLYINMDDYDSYLYKKPKSKQSATFNHIKALMRSPKCQARIHFGKASVFSAVSGDWTEKDLDYVRDAWSTGEEDMDDEEDEEGYTAGDGDAYARFRQIAMKWDPEGKFRDGEGFLE